MNEEEQVEVVQQQAENARIAEYSAIEQARLEANRNLLASRAKNTENTPKKLSTGSYFLMLIVAVLFDLVSLVANLLPFVGGLLQMFTITPIAMLVFFLWLKFNGINLTKGSRGLLTVLTSVVGFIPILNALPEWTMYITGIYISGAKISTELQKPLNKIRRK